MRDLFKFNDLEVFSDTLNGLTELMLLYCKGIEYSRLLKSVALRLRKTYLSLNVDEKIQ